MEAKSERKEGVLVFFINGRLDAFGAQQLDDWIKGALHDDDKELVLDLSVSRISRAVGCARLTY